MTKYRLEVVVRDFAGKVSRAYKEFEAESDEDAQDMIGDKCEELHFSINKEMDTLHVWCSMIYPHRLLRIVQEEITEELKYP